LKIGDFERRVREDWQSVQIARLKLRSVERKASADRARVVRRWILVICFCFCNTIWNRNPCPIRKF